MGLTKEQLIAANEIDQHIRQRISFVLDDGLRWERLGLGMVRHHDGVAHFQPSMVLMGYFADGEAEET